MNKNITYQKTVYTRKVVKTVKGGKNMSFYAVTIVGNQQGSVGLGVGKARTIANAIDKSYDNAIKKIITVNKIEFLKHKLCATEIIIKKRQDEILHAPNHIAEIFEAAGIRGVSCKLIRSRNVINGLFCVFDSLKYMIKLNKMKELKKSYNVKKKIISVK